MPLKKNKKVTKVTKATKNIKKEDVNNNKMTELDKKDDLFEKPIEEIVDDPEEIPEEIELDEEDEDDNFGDDAAEIEDEDKKIDVEDVDAEDEDDEDDKDTCLYNVDETSDNEDDIVFDDDDDDHEFKMIVEDSQRITKPFLFHYEKVRLIGDRTQQLTLGAKPMVKDVDKLTSKEIAELELKHNTIPLIIERSLPNGMKERWHVSELLH